MENDILDRKLEHEPKEPNPVRRISGIVRFSLILYIIGLFVVWLLSSTIVVNELLIFLTLIFIFLWPYASLYNMNQGKYELSGKKIIEKSKPRIASIIGLLMLIFLVFKIQIWDGKLGLLRDVNYIEPVIVILGSLFILYRDIVHIPQEIKVQQNE